MLRVTKPMEIIKHVVTASCIIAALYLTILCIHQYTLDKDTSSIHFKDFHADENSLYPSMSLCFRDDIFIGDVDGEKYEEFLSGCHYNYECSWNSSYANVDYDSVSKDYSKYILGERTYFADKSTEIYVYQKFPDRGTQVVGPKDQIVFGYNGGSRVHTSKRSPDQKCITLDIPYSKNNKVKFHSILLNNSVFADKWRPTVGGFDVSFHYPNQIMRQTSSKFAWNDDRKLLYETCEDGKEGNCTHLGSTYMMIFDIDHVSVLKRRNKSKEPCNTNWRNDDYEMRTKIAKSLQCKPNHWNLPLNIRICSNKTELEKSYIMEENPDVPSCVSVERYAFLYNEVSGLGFFEMDNDDFEDVFGIDWMTEEMNDEILSEITLNFVGKKNQ